MKIYFTAHVTGNGESKHYKKILSTLTHLGHTITSGKQIITPSLLEKDKGKTAEEIFAREKERIDAADCVIAEVTTPSSGVGGEIVYALMNDKPVLALFFHDAENTLSPMIAGNPSDHLFLEHYEIDNIAIKLKDFLREVKFIQKRRGKLIVIDGGDGSGKATQTELLSAYLKKHGMKVKTMDFPRYYSSFHGRIVGRFLSGEFGELNAVSPYLAALAYALDRASAKEEMDQWLSHGGVILSNRYATSSMAHQAAKLPKEKRAAFIEWLDEMEYKVHRIPREDIVVYLYVPWKTGYELTLKKEARKYVGGKLDIAEADMEHRVKSEEMYLTLAKTRKNWVKIDCVDAKGNILSKDTIHQAIVQTLTTKGILS